LLCLLPPPAYLNLSYGKGSEKEGARKEDDAEGLAVTYANMRTRAALAAALSALLPFSPPYLNGKAWRRAMPFRCWGGRLADLRTRRCLTVSPVAPLERCACGVCGTRCRVNASTQRLVAIRDALFAISVFHRNGRH